MKFYHPNQSYQFNRYPPTDNRSLKAWNAGDEYLLQRIEAMKLDEKKIAIYNDRFGFLSAILQEYAPYSIIQYKSQQKAFELNFEKNGLALEKNRLLSPLDILPSSIDLVLMKIPKSTELFELYLRQLLPALKPESIILASFMTRHFNKKIMAVAAQYFDVLEQSKAWKKSRILTLQKKKNTLPEKELIKTIILDKNHDLKQYLGVFSAHKIDIATQFLLQHLTIRPAEEKILDLASGNGVIAYHLRVQKKDCIVHLLDDDYLAIESTKLNIENENTSFHWADNMEDVEAAYFDLIVCNPPFHFEYENTIDIALNLFKGAKRCLNDGGRFIVVANLHLNYKTHLQRLFTHIVILAENERFIVYECL